jgi:spore germination cell wall hydrolase CwlJ-like protein
MANTASLQRPFAGIASFAAAARTRPVGLWRAHPRETLGSGLLVAVATIAVGTTLAVGGGEGPPASAPPAPPTMAVKALPVQQAMLINNRMPLADGPNPAAEAFQFNGNAAARAQAVECLASAVYYEAGNEPIDGQRAVAQVVLNRVRHPAFPASVCGVVYQGSTRVTGCQFTFTCDGSLSRRPDVAGWRRAKAVAEAALSGSVYAPAGWATHYHANYVVPVWAATLDKNAVVGAHLFYHWAGGWGRPAAFAQRYLGREASADGLRLAALAAEAATATTPEGQSVADAVADIPGAEAIKLAPSLRGDKRVAVRFKLAAREASDKADHKAYVEKYEASDNLRYALSGGEPSADSAPLGARSGASSTTTDR